MTFAQFLGGCLALGLVGLGLFVGAFVASLLRREPRDTEDMLAIESDPVGAELSETDVARLEKRVKHAWLSGEVIFLPPGCRVVCVAVPRRPCGRAGEEAKGEAAAQ